MEISDTANGMLELPGDNYNIYKVILFQDFSFLVLQLLNSKKKTETSILIYSTGNHHRLPHTPLTLFSIDLFTDTAAILN